MQRFGVSSLNTQPSITSASKTRSGCEQQSLDLLRDIVPEIKNKVRNMKNKETEMHTVDLELEGIHSWWSAVWRKDSWGPCAPFHQSDSNWKLTSENTYKSPSGTGVASIVAFPSAFLEACLEPNSKSNFLNFAKRSLRLLERLFREETWCTCVGGWSHVSSKKL